MHLPGDSFWAPDTKQIPICVSILDDKGEQICQILLSMMKQIPFSVSVLITRIHFCDNAFCMPSTKHFLLSLCWWWRFGMFLGAQCHAYFTFCLYPWLCVLIILFLTEAKQVPLSVCVNDGRVLLIWKEILGTKQQEVSPICLRLVTEIDLHGKAPSRFFLFSFTLILGFACMVRFIGTQYKADFLSYLYPRWWCSNLFPNLFPVYSLSLISGMHIPGNNFCFRCQADLPLCLYEIRGPLTWQGFLRV